MNIPATLTLVLIPAAALLVGFVAFKGRLKALPACSAFGLACAVVLHALALSGRVIGGHALLLVLFILLFVCFGSAVLRSVVRSLKDGVSRLDLTGCIPRLLLWPCLALLVYGFASGAGKETIDSGKELTPPQAARFEALMISFFSIALLIHVGLSTKEKPNPTLDATAAPPR